MKKMRLSIKQKFILAGTLTFISIVSILGTAQYTNSELRKFDDVNLNLSEIKSEMLMLRRNEKDFLARKDIKYKEKYQRNFKTLQIHTKKLSNAMHEIGIDSKPGIALAGVFNNYQTSFINLVELQQKIGLHAKDGLYGSLRKAVHAAETEINTLGDQRLRADMLQLRRNEKDFMLRHTMKYLNKFNKSIDVFNRDLAASTHPKAIKDKLQGLIKQYHSRFTQLVKINQEKGLTSKDGLMGKMRAAIHQSEVSLTKLQVTAGKAVVSKDNSLQVTNNSVGLVLVIILAGLLGWIAVGILRPIQTLATTMTQAANENNLGMRIQIDTLDEIGKTGLAFNSMLEKFQNIVGQVNGSTTQINTAVEQLSKITQETGCGIQEQTSQTDQVATAINEMSATVQEVSRNASEAASAATETTQEANTGLQVVNSAINSMDQLAKEIEQTGTVINQLEKDGVKIGAVLDVIRGIAEQTNLLALNAAIEAARAGEQGRGFAVVADEVRTLASRTQESTQEIQQMIESLQVGTAAAVNAMDASRSQAKQGVEKISAAGDALNTIVSGIKHINNMNTQIASASEEQSAVSEEINQNVMKISQISITSVTNSGKTKSASEELSRLSVDLQKLVLQFKA